MKRRIRYLFLLICICILGIICLQGYWLYNSYLYNYYGFRHNAGDALDVAVRHFIYGELKEGASQSSRELPDSANEMAYRDSRAAVRKWYLRNRKPEFSRNVPDSANPALESLYRQLATYWIARRSDTGKLHLSQLDSLLNEELRMRNIVAVYRLDTLYLKSDSHGRINWRDVKVEGFPISTRPIILNPLSGLWVQASFKMPVQYILGRMVWMLLASLLLTGFTIFCFIYMLNTILRQKKLSEIKSDFINNMTHELKTPITTVSAAVQALQHFDALADREKTDAYLGMAEKQLLRLSDLVEKVLDSATSEKKEMSLHPEKTDIQELLEETIRVHKLNALKPVSFQLYISLTNPQVFVDKTHLTNALNNLVDNAIKYSGEQVEISIRCQRMGNNLQIRIKDNGRGIPKAYQNDIFEKFFRVPTGNLHTIKGFGLGLSYVKTVVEMHEGTISVQSEEGKGTEFILTLPQ